MNTTHVFNKAVLNAKARTDIEDIDGLNVDDLLTALHREMEPAGSTSVLGKQAWALSIGIEIGKLLCDPATHLAEH